MRREGAPRLPLELKESRVSRLHELRHLFRMAGPRIACIGVIGKAVSELRGKLRRGSEAALF